MAATKKASPKKAAAGAGKSAPAKRISARPASTAQAGSAASDVDAQLARYRSMRDFASTAEPAGGHAASPSQAGLPFVIQKHAATRLHYDFRLGWHGVLKSWAVAKGPSYNTADKRLAVQVEDHPMEYGGFEGTIPKGQYGGGTVLVWDQGTWEPVPGHDIDEGLQNGSLKFTLHGTKLDGRWTLVRMGGRAANESKPNWLLIKEHDGKERAADEPPVTEEEPDSVVTGRSLEQIAEAADHVWSSRPADATKAAGGKARSTKSRLQQKLADAHLHGTHYGHQQQASPGKVTKAITKSNKTADPPKRSPAKPAVQSTQAAWIDSAPTSPMLAFVAPQLASAAEAVPPGDSWLYELKLDGYRVQAHVSASPGKKPAVTLFTRSGLDWTHRMRRVAEACAVLPVQQAILDGEVVALDNAGHSSFGRLQAAFEKGEAAELSYFAFDLLYLDGHDLRGLPLNRRKTLLQPLIAASGAAQDTLLFSQHLETDADKVYAHACELGAEGIIAKQRDVRYSSGRTGTWLKLKCTHRQEFVIAGFTLPKDKGAGLGSLLLGYYDGSKLIHCGRCGTGFTQSSARAVRKDLEPLRQSKPAYTGALSSLARKDAIWVEPILVCEVEFAAWTADGSLRHASFQGMRLDKPAKEVAREKDAMPATDVEEGSMTDVESVPEHSAEQLTAEPALAKKKRSSAGSKPASRAEASRKDESPDAPAPVTSAKTAPKLTHPEKILDAESGVNKQQLASYFAAVAPAMLPHLAGRAVSIVRCPNGTGKPGFFQKHAAAGLPASLGSVEVPDRADASHSEPYIKVETEDGLVALAQLGVLELHPWGSSAVSLEQPDRLILDLDPDESLPWKTLAASAQTIRAFLKELQIESFVKSTGGKGLHVVAALEPSVEWPELRLFARGIAAAIESSDPGLYLIKMTKAARKGRIFLDWMRNERGATAVAPLSPRARPGMRVAVPLEWDELADGLPVFSVANFKEWSERIKPANNPWAKMRPQRLRPEVLQAVLEHADEKAATRRKR